MSDKPIPCRAKKSEHTGDRIYWCTDPEWIEKLGGPTHEIWPIERSWFCGACGWQPEGVVGATWEELQDHIATCEKHPNSKLRAEIERLRVADSAKSKYIKELRVVNRALNDAQTNNLRRIEELEKITNNAIGLPFEEDDAVLYGHINMCERVANECLIIPRDKIRAAWEEANATTHLKYQNVTLLRFLEKHFDIVRCEGCGGDGHSMSTFAAKHEQVRTGTCPDCNGEGFKIGGGDE